MRTPPAYFGATQEDARRDWLQLEQSSWKQAVQHLFQEVQSTQHVISELLQNADDAGATHVRIRVEGDRFIFDHDGVDFTADQFQALCRFGVSSKAKIGRAHV